MPKERYLSCEERRLIIQELRLKQDDNRILKNHKSLKKFTRK